MVSAARRIAKKLGRELDPSPSAEIVIDMADGEKLHIPMILGEPDLIESA